MKKIFKTLFYSIALIILISISFLIFFYVQVSHKAGGRIERGVIDNIILSESPVYYDDQVTPIGVYFEKIHSKYIRYQNIPKNFIKALIASEDGDFFDHPGFDVKAILRAFIANCRAGRIVQGGSTITQQTAKNIFMREKRSYLSKLKELMQAILLERMYSKEEILEMYINQFFVTGFGKGLMIAAEYFFDKDARDLDLVESAFIAGMVKGPDRYNPFTKKTDEEKREALRLAKIRKNYVLDNMRKLNLITEKQYIDARDKEVPFNEGKVTYRLNVILDYIRGQLESVYFREILHEQGVDNIATSGIRIYTSVSREIQEGALDSIRRQLPLLDVQLTGYNKEQFQERYIQRTGNIYENPDPHLPFFCSITQINNNGNNPSITVAWDGGEGSIDYEGLKPVGEAWLKWKQGSPAVFDRSHVSDFIKNFHKGDQIPVHFVKNKNKDGMETLALWEIPDLEGGIIVLKNGMVKAMVGGFFDRYFNRAADAKRQVGSIFKPLVYTAALQLKWSNLDQLNNIPDLFTFENTYYLPRPDHEPVSDKVSMTWAGAKSENLATVWLLYHLTDRLNVSEFRDVVNRLGLGRKETESYNDYVKRIRDEDGVVVNQEALMEAAFEEAKKDIESDLIFSGNEDSLGNLSRLHFFIDEKRMDLKKDSDYQISRFSFKRLRNLNNNMISRFKKLNQPFELYENNRDAGHENMLKASMQFFYMNKAEEAENRIVYSEDPGKIHINNLEIIAPEYLIQRNTPLSVEDVWIDDIIPSEVINLIQANMNRRYKELLALNRYDLETLSCVKDFRILVNLLYVQQLAREMGISTWLDPVLSFPLGANSISILEAALTYQTIISGFSYPIDGENSTAMVPIITKIVDRAGETLWEYVPQPEKVLTNRISGSVTEILRMVVENGTGRRADGAVKLSMDFENGILEDIPIPAFGKTGTANLFTNSSFVGIIPELDPNIGEFDIRKGYVIASYVGYDDNRPMKGRNINISGASGALPLWIDTSNTIVNSHEYKKDVQIADLVFLMQSEPILADKTLNPVEVSSITGLPLSPTKDKDISEGVTEIYSDIDTDGALLTHKRVFEPLKGVDNEREN